MAGRGADDVAAAYHLYLTTVCRDVKHITIWLDNCAAQNKSWVLLTTLLKTVHSQETATETITLKFFEPGHTSMAADATHQSISKNLRRKGLVEDFADYEAATSAAGPQTIKMEPGVNMIATEDEVSRHALKRLSESNERPYLADFKSIQFQRGSEEVFTKTSLQEENWVAFTLMKTSFDVREPPALKCPTATVDWTWNGLMASSPNWSLT